MVGLRFASTHPTLAVLTVTVTFDNRYVVSGSRDNTLKILELSSGQNLAIFPTEGGVEACACAATGEIVCGDDSGHVYILRLEGV
jgi:WD40 repeat protein